MTRLKTSIALATFQSELFLRDQLDSYLTQNRLPDELIVSDDHSTDRTREIVEEFRCKASFKVLWSENQGGRKIASNFENAVRNCSGDIILFSDHDDVWLPNHIERLAGALESDKRILAVSSDSELVDQDLNPKGYTFAQSERYSRKLYRAVMKLPENQLELIVRQRIFNGHGIAFKKELVPVVLPFPENCIHDLPVLVLAAAIGRVTYIDEPLTRYRIHKSQTIGSERKSIKAVATTLSRQSGDEAPLWSAILERLRAFPHLGPHYEYSIKILEQKLEFVKNRTRNRSLRLPARLLNTSIELARGRYHRLGRGFVTFGRDLYGNRGQWTFNRSTR